MKKILIIAGPNGAGKTTFASEFLPNEADCPEFVNADLIAAGLSPFQPEKAALAAGRLMLQRIEDLVGAGKSFALGWEMFDNGYRRIADKWAVYDAQRLPVRLIETGDNRPKLMEVAPQYPATQHPPGNRRTAGRSRLHRSPNRSGSCSSQDPGTGQGRRPRTHS